MQVRHRLSFQPLRIPPSSRLFLTSLNVPALDLTFTAPLLTRSPARPSLSLLARSRALVLSPLDAAPACPRRPRFPADRPRCPHSRSTRPHFPLDATLARPLDPLERQSHPRYCPRMLVPFSARTRLRLRPKFACASPLGPSVPRAHARRLLSTLKPLGHRS